MLEALTALVFCPLSILSPSNPPSSSIVRTFPSLSPYNHNASTTAYGLTSLRGFAFQNQFRPFHPVAAKARRPARRTRRIDAGFPRKGYREADETPERRGLPSDGRC